MKKFLALVLVIFAVVLATVVGSRLSVDAMAVVVGVICGVGASIPTSLIILWLVGRRIEEKRALGNLPGYPPVVIVNPGQMSNGYRRQEPEYLLPPFDDFFERQSARQFKIVGEEETPFDRDWRLEVGD